MIEREGEKTGCTEISYKNDVKRLTFSSKWVKIIMYISLKGGDADGQEHDGVWQMPRNGGGA